MHRIGKGLAALTLASAGVATALVGAASPASAGGGVVDVKVGKIVVAPSVDADFAANLCNVNVGVIEALNKGEKTVCIAKNTPIAPAYIIKK